MLSTTHSVQRKSQCLYKILYKANNFSAHHQRRLARRDLPRPSVLRRRRPTSWLLSKVLENARGSEKRFREFYIKFYLSNEMKF